nr:CAZy families GH73 protein [uncultured Ruminococcus sp.]
MQCLVHITLQPTQSENDNLVSVGWHGEGIGWYAVEAGTPYSIGSNIMGTSKTTVEQMVAWYNSKGHIYPSDSLSAGGASTIADFAEIVYEEAKAEGVRAEVVFLPSDERDWVAAIWRSSRYLSI